MTLSIRNSTATIITICILPSQRIPLGPTRLTMPKSSNQKNSFRFRTGIDLGSGVAELDNVQDECFLFTDAYQAISDHENHLCVIVGKAGSGKSAIIRQLLLEKSNNIIRIHPQQLAFHFLRGSELLASLRQTGINMSLFYKLLWRHVFIIEILKHMFPEEVQLPGPFSGILTKLHIKRRNKKTRSSVRIH